MKISLKIINNGILFLSIFMFISCHNEPKEVISDKLYNYQQLGWKSFSKTININDISYKATEVPIEYYFLKNAPINKIDSLSKSYQDERVIEIEFSQSGHKDLLSEEFTGHDYTYNVKYIAFNIKRDFSVVVGNKDTIACSGVLFERNYKLTDFKRLLLYFDHVPPGSPIKLIYYDQLFGNGILKFDLSQRPIKL